MGPVARGPIVDLYLHDVDDARPHHHYLFRYESTIIPQERLAATTASSNSGDEGGTPSADEEPLPPPVSEADLVQAVEMLDEFSERTEAHYIQDIEHVKGPEGDVNSSGRSSPANSWPRRWRAIG